MVEPPQPPPPPARQRQAQEERRVGTDGEEPRSRPEVAKPSHKKKRGLETEAIKHKRRPGANWEAAGKQSAKQSATGEEEADPSVVPVVPLAGRRCENCNAATPSSRGKSKWYSGSRRGTFL